MTRTVVLVLDYAYQPCEIIDWTRALTLLYLDKAEIVEDGDDLIRSANSQHRIPAVIRDLFDLKIRSMIGIV